MVSDQSKQKYFRESGSLLYSYLICLPLLLLYEILILISQPGSDYLIRISVDAWFKAIFSVFGLNALSFTLFIAAALGAIILWNDRSRLKYVKIRYFFLMLAEALIYAVLLAVLISAFLQSILMAMVSFSPPIEALTTLQLLALSLGAGLYEELFFRVILVSALLWGFKKVFIKNWAAYTTAVILAALCFSAVHYTGEFGDTFQIGSFLFRFLFGLALNLIYVMRGFGMAAWTHAIYDVLVILIM